MFTHGVIQILCESFFENEGKDVKQQNFFTANNKQYLVLLKYLEHENFDGLTMVVSIFVLLQIIKCFIEL